MAMVVMVDVEAMVDTDMADTAREVLMPSLLLMLSPTMAMVAMEDMEAMVDTDMVDTARGVLMPSLLLMLSLTMAMVAMVDTDMAMENKYSYNTFTKDIDTHSVPVSDPDA